MLASVTASGFLELVLPYLGAFLGALAATLVLTPFVREWHRRIGMVDRPDPRRINRVPIPRGGGLALVVGVVASYAIFHAVTGRPCLQGLSDARFLRAGVLAVAISLLGLADDRWGLSPRVKLAGQLAVAALVWFWCGLGFARLWPSLPPVVDFLLTVFWITGAVNAFNLIDGLDGLASGLALIATLGMAGALFFTKNPQATLFYFAFAGGLFGFLRYNYNPASVFLGDSGSMFIGYVIATLPLASQEQNSFLVSVGMPLLAMGVPIFDTSLAILRRSLRHVLLRRTRAEGEAGAGKVMTADTDHLHHRILRSAGLNQRRAAWALYAFAAFLVAVGLVGLSLESRAAGLWIVAVAVISVVVFKDMARIELFDAGRLLCSVAHNRESGARRRWARLAVPFYVVFDLGALVAAYFLLLWAFGLPFDRVLLRVALPLRVFITFFALVGLHTYRTVWSRAMASNFARLLFACAAGALVSGAVVFYVPYISYGRLKAFTLGYFAVSLVFIVVVRLVRGLVRDLFYAIDCSRLKTRKDVSRILVYGTGLRYRAFRRELVRSTSANERMVVGLLDDDLLLRGQYIGGLRILGTINQAPEIINAVNADAVVIACEISDEWMRVVREILRPTGVKVTHFTFGEREVPPL